MGNRPSSAKPPDGLSRDFKVHLFEGLDTKNEGCLSLKELMAATSLDVFMPHSLPALYFVDNEKDGRLTPEEFAELLRLCLKEKEHAQDIVCRDKNFRDVITRASAAGVKDCSIPCRTSFRRFYSYSNVLSVYDKNCEEEPKPNENISYAAVYGECHTVGSSSSSPRSALTTSDDPATMRQRELKNTSAQQPFDWISTAAEGSHARDEVRCGTDDERDSISDGGSDGDCEIGIRRNNDGVGASAVARVRNSSSNGVFEHTSGGIGTRLDGGGDGECSGSDSDRDKDSDSDCSSTSCSDGGDGDCDGNSKQDVTDSRRSNAENGDRTSPGSVRLEPLDADCSTAIDAAVVESVSRMHIHKLVDALQCEGAREEFMKWLWNLVDFNSSGVVTLEELKVFLQALREDGIDLEELAFYKERGVPLDECIINEFDTTHSGGLEQDEFMVFADLVTREYEYWESRHLDCIGDYKLGRTIGRGSSGVVRLGVHVDTHEKFAVKIIRKGRCADMSSVDREIQALKAGAHAHIVELVQVLESAENMFLILGLCGGGSLANIVQLYPDHRMPERTARFYVRQILEALAFCHEKGICHRDVRLDNILLDNAGMVKVTDFGHSKTFSVGWDLHSSTLVGSIYNLSPEQVAGQLYSGEKIDIWSTGVAVYCLLVGRPPFHDLDTVKLLENISSCTFLTPDFLSDEASDLVRCMIRASQDERLPLSQVLQHPWFYVDNDECPQMDVYKIAVDSFFIRRPDLAELIMAGTIHEHNLHFHLADKLNPTSSPEDLRGQDWSLKCLCPQMDIKFAVSFFSRPPIDGTSSCGTSPRRIPNVSSFSVLEDSCSPGPVVSRKEIFTLFEDDAVTEDIDRPLQWLECTAKRRACDPSLTRSASLNDCVCQDWSHSAVAQDCAPGYLPIDAFPHRKVLPRKAVPEATRLFDSDVRIAAAAASAVPSVGPAAAQHSHLHRSVTMEGVVASSSESRRRALVEGESITSLVQKTSKDILSPRTGFDSKRASIREPTEFVPFIEVRLQCGESGLFLRICQKLKTICETKLAAAAESQRKRSQGRKTAAASIFAFRQTVD
jgi:serine/threonine protein kinase/Ca2+-binding EF-hand superfamily protein